MNEVKYRESIFCVVRDKRENKVFKVVGEDTVNNTELLSTLIDDLNVRGATAFIHLVQASDEFTQAVEDSKNAGGELDEMVRIQNESMRSQIQILKNSW